MFKKYHFFKRHNIKGADFVDIYEETEKHERLVCSIPFDIFDQKTYVFYKSKEF